MPPPMTSIRFGIDLQLQRAGRIDDARIVGHERQLHRLAAGGDDRLLEAHDLLRAGLVLPAAVGQLHFEMVRVEEAPDAAHDLDLARLGHAGEAAGELLDDAFLEAAQLVDVDLRRAERDAVMRRSLSLRRSPTPCAAAPSTECSRRSGRRRRASHSARPARSSCRGRRRGTRRSSRPARRRAPASRTRRRPGRHRSAAGRCRPGPSRLRQRSTGRGRLARLSVTSRSST